MRGGKPEVRTGTAAVGGPSTTAMGSTVSLGGVTFNVSVKCPDSSKEAISFSFNRRDWTELAIGAAWEGPARCFEMWVGSAAGTGTYQVLAIR